MSRRRPLYLQQTVRASVNVNVPGVGGVVGAVAQPPVAGVDLKWVPLKAALSLIGAQPGPMFVAP